MRPFGLRARSSPGCARRPPARQNTTVTSPTTTGRLLRDLLSHRPNRNTKRCTDIRKSDSRVNLSPFALRRRTSFAAQIQWWKYCGQIRLRPLTTGRFRSHSESVQVGYQKTGSGLAERWPFERINPDLGDSLPAERVLTRRISNALTLARFHQFETAQMAESAIPVDPMSPMASCVSALSTNTGEEH